MEFPLDPKGLASPLADTDVLRIYPILAAYQKTVILRGDVANPGRFNWHPGMHLSDLIPDKDSLESRDYWWRRSHLGLPSPEFEPLISSPESLPSALTATNHSGSWSDSEAAAANGNNTSIASQLPKTGSAAQQGPIDVHLANAEIDWDYAVIERLDPDSLRTSLIPFDLGKLVMNHDAPRICFFNRQTRLLSSLRAIFMCRSNSRQNMSTWKVKLFMRGSTACSQAKRCAM